MMNRRQRFHIELAWQWQFLEFAGDGLCLQRVVDALQRQIDVRCRSCRALGA